MTTPDYPDRKPRWLKVQAGRPYRDGDVVKVAINCKLRWWWKLAVLARVLRTVRLRVV